MATSSPGFSRPPTAFNTAGPNKLAQAGATGPTGATGATGATGPTGPAGDSILAAPNATATGNIPLSVGLDRLAGSAFSFVNQHSATLTDNANGPLVWVCPTATVSNTLSLVSTPTPVSGAWTYTLHASCLTQASSLCPIGVTDGTKVMVIAKSNASVQVEEWNSVTSFSTFVYNESFGQLPDPFWYRVAYDPGTTTLSFSVSNDGYTWTVLNTTTSPFLTPSGMVFGANISANASIAPATISVDYLVQS